MRPSGTSPYDRLSGENSAWRVFGQRRQVSHRAADDRWPERRHPARGGYTWVDGYRGADDQWFSCRLTTVTAKPPTIGSK